MLMAAEGGIPLKLQIKRMRFGNCTVLEGRRSRLIVDCGGRNQAADGSLSARAFAYAAIAPQVGDLLPTHILISHLHTDHYRGFLELGRDTPPLFRGNPPVAAAYLPWVILGGRAVLAAPFARLYLTAPPRTLAHQLALGLLELLPVLEREAGSRQMLQAGDTISLDGQRLEVLWPQVEPALNALPVCGGEARADQAEVRMARAFSALPQGEGPLEEGQRALSEALERYLLLLNGGALAEAGRLAALEALARARAAADRLRKEVWGDQEQSLHPPYPHALQPLARFARQQYRLLADTLNACGLVLQWKDKVLLPGDVPPAVLEYLAAEGRLHPRYQVVQLPHHGTESHLSPALPQAERYIISNGGYRRRPVGRQVLEELAAACPGCAFLCTDAHTAPAEFCQYARAEGRCHPACKPITGEQAILPL